MDNRKAIYLDDAIDALESKKDKKAKGDIGGFYNKIIQNDIDALMQLPSADPEAAIVKVLKMVEEYKEKTGTDEIIIMPKNGMKAWDENGVEYTMQPTCNKLETDCISRQGVIDVLSQYPFEKVVNCISIIEEFPSAQPEGKKGVFIPDITVEMLRKASLEAVEDLLTSGEMKDIVLPSTQPYTEEQIQKLQDMEQAQLEEAYKRGYEEGQGEIVLCKDCKHRPVDSEDTQGFGVEFPDEKCPCQCEDGWYNWRPDDEWFCANAERRTDDRD